MNDLSSLTLVAIHAAMNAGEILRKGFATKYEISSKEGIQNIVTQFDNLAEDAIISFISKRYPKHSFLAEESGMNDPEGSDVLWVIDPLDGTLNFAHNIPVFTVTIAATIENQIVSGIVYQPMSHELFVAEKNNGAFLNGKELKVSKIAEIQDAFMATGFPYNVNENPQGCINRFANMQNHGVPIRRIGSAALDLAYVASGKFDAYWELSLHPWDIAAGKLLIEEAGGKVTQYNGKEHTVFTNAPILATNGLLHDKMVKELTRPI